MSVKLEWQTKAQENKMDERGITLEVVILVAIGALMAAGIAVIIYNLIAEQTSTLSETAGQIDRLKRPRLFLLTPEEEDFLENPTTTIPTPVPVSLERLASGPDHSCAVDTTAGSVKCWGRNSSSELGMRTGSPHSGVLIDVPTLTNVESLSLGIQHSCAIVNNPNRNEVWCWGWNQYGQIGTSAISTSHNNPPTKVAGFEDVATIEKVSAATTTICAIVSTTPGNADNKIRCWGRNDKGQLGISPGVPESNPTPNELSFTGVIDIAVGTFHTCALIDTGVKCWGDNTYGQLGANSIIIETSEPQSVVGLPTANRVTSIVAGRQHTCALTNIGEVWCWGDNNLAQIARAPQTASIGQQEDVRDSITMATKIRSLTGVKSIHTSYELTCAITSTNAVSCWGDNGKVEITDRVDRRFLPDQGREQGSFQNSEGRKISIFLLVDPTPIPTLTNIREISVLRHQVCAIDETSSIQCLGFTAFLQQLGPFGGS